MDDLYLKIDIVLNECSRTLNNIEKEEFNSLLGTTIFKVCFTFLFIKDVYSYTSLIN